MKNLCFWLSIAFVTCLNSCKEKTLKQSPEPVDQIQITIQPVFGTKDLKLDQTVVTAEGYRVQFTEICFYLTGLKNNKGDQIKQAVLFHYRENGTLLLNADIKATAIDTLNAYFGVDSTLNHDDPTLFPATSPLNILIANDMHWGWNPGYIFVKIEAKVDVLVDGVENFNHFVVFHIGGDELIQKFQLKNISWIAKGQGRYELPLKLDMQKFLQNGNQIIDLKTEHTSHSSPGEEVLSQKVIQNLKDALSPL